MIRIIKIAGRDSQARRTRLQRVQAWMSAGGWRLADYSDEEASAMFEREGEGGLLERFHPTCWLPGPEAWKPSQWWILFRAEPRLAIAPLLVAVLLGVGWFASSRPSGPEGRTVEESADEWRVVNTRQLNIRESPSTQAQILGVLYRDQRVRVEGEVNDTWVRIDVPQRGYVASEYLDKPPAESNPP